MVPLSADNCRLIKADRNPTEERGAVRVLLHTYVLTPTPTVATILPSALAPMYKGPDGARCPKHVPANSGDDTLHTQRYGHTHTHIHTVTHHELALRFNRFPFVDDTDRDMPGARTLRAVGQIVPMGRKAVQPLFGSGVQCRAVGRPRDPRSPGTSS